MNKSLNELAARVAVFAGRPRALVLALALVCAWSLAGWRFALPSIWWLVGHTAFFLLILLVLFLIRRAQENQVKEIDRKLDELARGVRAEQPRRVALKDLSDQDLKRLQRRVQRLRRLKLSEKGNGHHESWERRKS